MKVPSRFLILVVCSSLAAACAGVELKQEVSTDLDRAPGQVAFIKRFGAADRTSIPQIEDLILSSGGSSDGLLGADVYKQNDDPESYLVYGARAGTEGSAKGIQLTRSASALLSSADWYRPLKSFRNLTAETATHQSSFVRVVFVKHDGKSKQIVLEKLYDLIAVAMSDNPALLTATVHEGMDNPDAIMLYEKWSSSRETFLAEELPKEYRTTFRKTTDQYFDHKIDTEWILPVSEFETRSGVLVKVVP